VDIVNGKAGGGDALLAQRTDNNRGRLQGFIQMRSHSLLRRKMVYICSCYAQTALILGSTTTCAGASVLNGREISRIGGVSEIEYAIWCDGVSETLCDIYQYSCIFSLYCCRKLTAVRVGQTQSNISAPKATDTTRSSGYPWENNTMSYGAVCEYSPSSARTNSPHPSRIEVSSPEAVQYMCQHLERT
jgi:hypothetical protein